MLTNLVCICMCVEVEERLPSPTEWGIARESLRVPGGVGTLKIVLEPIVCVELGNPTAETNILHLRGSVHAKQP